MSSHRRDADTLLTPAGPIGASTPTGGAVRKLLFVATMALLIKGSAADSVQPRPMPMPAAAAAATPATLTVMTYNVAAMPWPVAMGRPQALAAIAERLRRLRRTGQAPQVVVLQEAFTEEARAIGAAAGYRYRIDGPSAETPRPRPPVPLDAAFLAARSSWTGERTGPWISSGLMILSDYPIRGVARAAFPQDACAGFDCLANKGVLLAKVALPGLAAPVEIVTAHLNAGRKSGTPTAHNLYAYRQQMAALDRFLARQASPDLARIMAGDFNVSHSTDRLARFKAMWRRAALIPVTAMGRDKHATKCGRESACDGALPIAPNVPLIHANDWQFYASGRAVTLAPLRRTIPFGREPDGGMLSDHIGYSVTYAVARRG